MFLFICLILSGANRVSDLTFYTSQRQFSLSRRATRKFIFFLASHVKPSSLAFWMAVRMSQRGWPNWRVHCPDWIVTFASTTLSYDHNVFGTGSTPDEYVAQSAESWMHALIYCRLEYFSFVWAWLARRLSETSLKTGLNKMPWWWQVCQCYFFQRFYPPCISSLYEHSLIGLNRCEQYSCN